MGIKNFYTRILQFEPVKMKKYASYIKQIVKGRLTHRRIPILVTLCITNKCNLRCIYCYKENIKADNQEFTTKQMISLIDELAQAGTKYISLNGGEALLKDGIDLIVERIKHRNMLCHLSTNGLLIKDNIPMLKMVDSLAISIDGAKISNDANRGQGSFERIIQAIELLKRNRIRFHTHTVLTRNNTQAVEEIMSLAQRYKCRAQFSTLRVEGPLDKENCLRDAELRQVIQKIINYKKRGFPVFFSQDSYENALAWPFSYLTQAIFTSAPRGYMPIRCYIKRFSCHIEPNGLVYPCIVLVGKMMALNSLEVGFKKAWDYLSSNECIGCYNICCNDLNLIFSLKPRAVWNACKITSGRLFDRKG